MSAEGAPTLGLAGVDLLRDRDGRWRVIEVNSQPAGLAAVAALDAPGGSPSGRHDALAALAALLIRHASNERIGLVLPDAFTVDGPIDGPVRFERDATGWVDDLRVDRVLRDFERLAFALALAGALPVTGDVRHFHATRDAVRVGGAAVGALFCRDSRFPPHATACFCVNDRRQRTLCGDKQRTHDLVRGALGDAMIPTYPLHADADTLAFLEAAATRDDWIIVKPRQGSASIDVRRLRAPEALRCAMEAVPGTTICQPWIAPATVRHDGHAYHHDLRVFVVGGVAVGGVARRAAAPPAGATADSPLAWLTTTGPLIPLREFDREHSSIEAAFALAAATVGVLDRAAPALDFDDTIREMPSFATTSGVLGRLRPIAIHGRV